MQIINVNKPGNSNVIMIFVPIGSRFENSKLKGIFHFIEHLLFKGTKNRTQKEISLGIEKYGGILNAFTDWEITGYYAKVANDYKKQALNIIQDLVSNPIFPAKEITKERKVILEELKMYEDNPIECVYRHLHKILYKDSSGLHLPIEGTRESLKKINKKTLEEYHKDYYENLILIQVGNFKEQSTFVPFKETIYPESLPDKKRKTLIKREDITQASIIISNYVNLVGLAKIEKLMIFKLLSAIYNGMSGRLFQTIREKHHLAYRVNFNAGMYSCGGIQWTVSLGLKPNKIDKTYKLIMKELTKPITREELGIAITKLLGAEKLEFDNVYNIAEQIAYCLITGIDYREVIYKSKGYYEKIGNDINEYLKRINFSDNVTVGIIPNEYA